MAGQAPLQLAQSPLAPLACWLPCPHAGHTPALGPSLTIPGCRPRRVYRWAWLPCSQRGSQRQERSQLSSARWPAQGQEGLAWGPGECTNPGSLPLLPCCVTLVSPAHCEPQPPLTYNVEAGHRLHLPESLKSPDRFLRGERWRSHTSAGRRHQLQDKTWVACLPFHFLLPPLPAAIVLSLRAP